MHSCYHSDNHAGKRPDARCATRPQLHESVPAKSAWFDESKDVPMRTRHLPCYWWYRFRGWLMAPLALVMLLCKWHETESHVLAFGLGGAVFCGGWVLRIWAQGHLHYRLKVRKNLTTTGPYAYVRNPVYIANTLILIGMSIMSELLWLCPLAALYCAVVYTFVVRYEEGHLAAKYGGPYCQYLQRVPRWLPLRRTWRGLVQLNVRPFLFDGIKSELHAVLLLALPLLKELV